ncbi:MAG: zinc-ribbon domain-containing protein [Kiritimatiellae bacterium]|nr:zinc-ribbon domain-containing protein [Kiritimatiellia bacterium]
MAAIAVGDLIKCPECRAPVSDKAERCPRCGFPLKAERAKDESIARVVKEMAKETEKGYIVCVAKAADDATVLWIQLFLRVTYEETRGLAKKGVRYEEVLRHPVDQTGRVVIEANPGKYRISVVDDPKKRAKRRDTRYVEVMRGSVVPCSFVAE